VTITTIRPGSDTYVGSVTFTGAATGWQATNDNSDSSYITAANGACYPKALVRVKPVSGGVSVGASSRILRVRLNARIRMSAAASGQAGTIRIAERSPYGQYDYWEQHQYSDAVTYTTRQGTWRTKPPRGYGDEWTLASLEASSAEIQFAPPAFGPNLRLSEIYWDVDVRDRATVTSISITNPLASTQPLVTWQFNPNFDGDPQTAYRVKVFSSQQYTAWGFDPDTAQSVWDSGVVYSNANQVTVGRKLENGQTYAAWVMVAADFGGQKWWSVWNNSPPATIILTPLPPPTMIGSTTDQAGLRNLVRVQGNWNNLPVQDADFNNAFLGVGTWASFFGGGTVTRVTTPVAEGAGAMQAQKNGSSGDLDLLTAGGNTGFKVKAGQTYTALASFRSAATPRTAKIGISWYDRTGTAISIDLSPSGVTTSTTSWIQDSYTGAAPANAVYGAAWAKIQSCAASEVHYLDKVAVATNVILGSGTISGTSGTSRPEVAAIYRSGYWDSPSKVIACKAVPPASLLVAVTLSGRSASVTGNVVTSTGGLTWTNRRENTTSNTGDASISTAYFAAGGDIDVTVTGNQGDAVTLVYAVTGHDEATYGGAHNLATGTSGSASVSLTTGRENSLVIVAVGDYNEVNGNLTRAWKKPGQTFVEDWYGDFGEGVTYSAHYWMPNAGAATHGLNGPSGQAYGIVAIEVRGASFNTTQTVYTGWTRGGWVGSGSTVVERALVSTGRRNNAHPQLWSGGDWLKTTDGFYLPSGTEDISRLVYDVEQNYQGQGSIRWDVNNAGSVLYMGWEDGPRWLGEPPYAMLGIEGHTYTFSLYAKADASFSSALYLQALDQFGGPVGSATSTGAISIGTSWTQYTVNLVMPMGCLWVRAHLENSASATERRVWVDGVQWCEGGTVDVVPAMGEGATVEWEPIRYAGPDEWFITDGETALTGTIQDTECPPGYGAVYRAYNYMAATDSVPALASPITFYATNRLNPPGAGIWWLRDPQDAAIQVRLRVTGLDETMHEESATFYPLRQGGEPQRAVTVTDYIGGEDGSIKALVDSEAEWLLVRELFKKARPMFLILPDFGARYVRINDRSWSRSTAKTRTSWTDTDPWRREISLTFLESDAP